MDTLAVLWSWVFGQRFKPSAWMRPRCLQDFKVYERGGEERGLGWRQRYDLLPVIKAMGLAEASGRVCRPRREHV